MLAPKPTIDFKADHNLEHFKKQLVIVLHWKLLPKHTLLVGFSIV